MTKPEISYEDFEKLDLKVGEIIDVEEIPNADKLYKLTIDIGEETKTVCAGIKQYYSKDDLKGKKIILLANLAPRKLKGIESQGMLLAAVNSDENEVILLSPESEIEVGAKIR
jgi:methionine--tRNA ligase beta chain